MSGGRVGARLQNPVGARGVSLGQIAYGGLAVTVAMVEAGAMALAESKAPPAAADPTTSRQVIYSPWTKFCSKDQNQGAAKKVCLTVKEARLETGQFLAGAALIEQEGDE